MEPKFTLQDLFTVIRNKEKFENFLSDNKLVPLGEDARCANCGNHCIVTVKEDNSLRCEKYAYCNSCKWHCSLTKDTVFFNSSLDPEDVMIFVYCFCVLLLVDTSLSLEVLYELTGFAKSVIIDWHILCSEVCKVKVDDGQCRNEVQYPFDSENPNKSLLLSYTLKFPVHSFKERFFLFLRHVAEVYPGPFKCCPSTEIPFVSCGISTEKEDVPVTVRTQVDVPIMIETELDVYDGLVGDKEYQLLEIDNDDVDLEVNFTAEEEDIQPPKKKPQGEALPQDVEEIESVFSPEVSPAHLLNRESCQVANNVASQAASEKIVEEWEDETPRESNAIASMNAKRKRAASIEQIQAFLEAPDSESDSLDGDEEDESDGDSSPELLDDENEPYPDPSTSTTYTPVEQPATPIQWDRDITWVQWDRDITWVLLETYEKFMEKSSKKSLSQVKIQIWNKIATSLGYRKFNCTGVQCKKKLESMKLRYQQIKRGYQKTGSIDTTWEFYDIMDELFADDTVAKPVPQASAVTSVPLPKECLPKQNDEIEVVYEGKSSSLENDQYRPHEVFIVEDETSQQHKQSCKKKNYWHSDVSQESLERSSQKHQTSEEIREAIIILHSHGVPVPRIAEEVGVHKRTVSRWISRFKTEGTTATRRRSGRPRITTKELDQAIVKEVESQRVFSSNFLKDVGLGCSVEKTVRRRLHARMHAYKPELTECHMEHRMEFALTYADKGLDFWQQVVICDEKTFSQKPTKSSYFWEHPKTSDSKGKAVPSTNNDRVSCGMWACFSMNGVGDMVEVDGELTGEKYVDILENTMLPSVRCSLVPEGNFYLLKDNSLMHTSTIVKQWFESHPEIVVLNWPPNSPDLNPMETLWAIIARDWDDDKVRSKENLVQYSKAVWLSFLDKPNLIDRLVRSIPRRLNATIAIGGEYTK